MLDMIDIKWTVMEIIEENPKWTEEDIIYNKQEIAEHYIEVFEDEVHKKLRDTIWCAVEEMEMLLDEEDMDV